MSTVTPTDVARIPPITRTEAGKLAATEYGRMVDQLRSLTTADWDKPTECPLWDVRAMAGHSVGMMGDFTGFGPLMRRMRAATAGAKKSGEVLVDVMTGMQVADNADLGTGALIAKADQNRAKAAGWRTKSHLLFSKAPLKDQVVGDKTEKWRMGYLLTVILTRDPWMHRVDISRATGRELVLTADHDGRIVADVVAEWARRHGRPFTLDLTGPAGGRFVGGGSDGESITIDAVEFCRILSGRAGGTGLLTQLVPF